MTAPLVNLLLMMPSRSARMPDTKVINLSESELAQLMAYTGTFKDTLVIANAYGKKHRDHWIG